MILVVHSVAANEHDSRGLKSSICKLGYKPREVYADKGTKCLPTCLTFIVEASNMVYRRMPIEPSLSRIAILFKKLVSKNRWVVEHTFGSIKRWFVSRKDRYKRLARVHAQRLMSL
ncbi:MAG: transposase [Flavobacteriales bacterium Tduv]